jgi:pyrroloquinoline-quinone synthase
VSFFDRVDDARKRWNVLRHPFYERWSRGELGREELAFYAAEYRHLVVALAETARRSTDADHAAEEQAHVALWDRFAGALGAATARAPLPETSACVAAWTAGGREGLAVLYAVESNQPAISQTKLDGLRRYYGLADGEATSYFRLHSTLDVEHAAHAREQLEPLLGGSDEDALVAAAGSALEGNWHMLTGVQQSFAG